MVTIEPITDRYLDSVHKYASDKLISDTSNVPHPYSREMADDWFKIITTRQESGQAKVFSILSDNEFVGVITLNNINLESKQAEIDYWVAVNYHGRGIATLAVAELIKHASDILGIKTFISGALARNIASHKVQKKNGFRIVEEFKLKEGKFTGEDYIISKLEIA